MITITLDPGWTYVGDATLKSVSYRNEALWIRTTADNHIAVRFYWGGAIALGSTSIYKVAGLEYGDKQTIAYKDANGNWQPTYVPGFGAELARCQRHYVEGIVQAVVNPWPGLTFLGGTSFPVEMAKTPVLKIFTKKGGEENKVFDLNGNAQTPLVVETYPTTKGIKTIRLDGTLESTKSYSYYYTASTGM
mgnify:CR=1 FL=1